MLLPREVGVQGTSVLGVWDQDGVVASNPEVMCILGASDDLGDGRKSGDGEEVEVQSPLKLKEKPRLHSLIQWLRRLCSKA